jgi:hypothetical protein
LIEDITTLLAEWQELALFELNLSDEDKSLASQIHFFLLVFPFTASSQDRSVWNDQGMLYYKSGAYQEPSNHF